MLGAVLYNLIPSSRGSFQLLLEQWWLMPLLIMTSLILFWRHSTLAYGDIRIRNGWSTMCAVALLLITPYFFGVVAGNTAHIHLLLCILMMDHIVSSISMRRSTFFVYDVGLLIGLLSMLHPIYLLLLPYSIIKFYQIKISSTPHVLAQLLGVVTIWVLLVLFFAEPTLESITEVLSRKISPILSPALPKLEDLFILIGLLLFLSIVMALFYNTYRGSISRVRYLYLTHIRWAWLILPVEIFYGAGGDISAIAFMLLILIFPSSPALYFCSNRRNKQQTTLFFLVAMIFFILAYWRGIYLPNTSPKMI